MLLSPMLVLMALWAAMLLPDDEVVAACARAKAAAKEIAHLEGELQASRAESDRVEARRQRAEQKRSEMQEAMRNLQSELSALGNAEDRIKFLTRVDDVNLLAAERAWYKKQHIATNQECERYRVQHDDRFEELQDLKTKLSEASKDLDSSKALVERIGAEKASVQASLERAQKIADHWEQKTAAVHQELKDSKKGQQGADEEQEQLRLEYEAKLRKKSSEVKGEERQRRLLFLEKKISESSAKELQRLLLEREEELAEFRDQAERTVLEQSTSEQRIEELEKEVETLKEDLRTRGKVEKETAKQREKQRKNDDKLLDLELEIASTRADVERAKHQAELATSQAAEQTAKADEAVKAMDADRRKAIQDRRKAIQDFQRCAQANQHLAVQNQKLQEVLKAHAEKHNAFEAKLKDAERDKIRLRIDLKRLGDSKLELEEQLRERVGTKSEQANASSAEISAGDESANVHGSGDMVSSQREDLDVCRPPPDSAVLH